jgi:hypothetical protein
VVDLTGIDSPPSNTAIGAAPAAKSFPYDSETTEGTSDHDSSVTGSVSSTEGSFALDMKAKQKKYPIGLSVDVRFQNNKIYRGTVDNHWVDINSGELFFHITYKDDEHGDLSFEEMEEDRVTRVGEDGDFTDDKFVELQGMKGPYKGTIWYLETRSPGILFGKNPMRDDPTDTCVLARMGKDKKMQPTHAYVEYVEGKGVHVIDKSGDLTIIAYIVSAGRRLPQSVDLDWAQLGQIIKIGKTILKVERRRRPLGPLED